jgi:phage terminase large subunit
MEIDVRVPEKLIPLIVKPKPLKILVGGRGSGKSETVAQCMLKHCADGSRVLCAREFQNSLDDSVHSLLKRKIDDLGITTLTALASAIQSANGEIIYKGLARNIQSIKSLDNIGFVWIEEGQTISQESIDTLFPTIRKNGAEIWITMNRGSVTDPVSVSFLTKAEPGLERCGYYEDDYMIVIEINWRDNPFFPEILNQQRLKNKAEWSSAKYDHIWEGKYGDIIEDPIIQPEWFDACIDAHLNPKISAALKARGARLAAFDPSDTGDAKGYAQRIGNVFTDVCDKKSGDSDDGMIWATDKAIAFGCDEFVWDYSGIGSGMLGSIRKSFAGKKTKLQAFNGGESPDDKDKPYISDDGKKKTVGDVFINKRAQRYWRLYELCYNTYRCIVKGDYVDPDDMISFSSDIKDIRRLRSEICRIPRKRRGDGVIQIMTKKEMLQRKIPSPNMADAVMMLIFQPVVTQEFKEIEFEGWA